MNLYELTSNYKSIQEKLFNPETGEIDQFELENLNLAEGDVKEKSIAVAKFIKNIEAERVAIDDALSQMKLREVRLYNKIDYLTNYLKSNMEKSEINEISCPYFEIKIKKCPVSVNVIDEELVPIEYKRKVIKETISIDKTKIKDAITGGAVIPGAELKQNTRLEIK
jgi:hypothetical protein